MYAQIYITVEQVLKVFAEEQNNYYSFSKYITISEITDTSSWNSELMIIGFSLIVQW